MDASQLAALADRYRIERELGAGGMATVYLAHDLKHDRKVAIKVLRPELAAVIGAARFLTEIKTTANLQHPHILSLHDSGTVDGTVFYVMPFVEGESLRDRLNREKQLPIGDAVRIATEVAGALDYAHRHAVIHRDIKPENILLHDGRALVADFGIALAATSADSRMTETGMSLGTPHYMSPEQAMGERNLDARTDVYALGCVLYEMLTGAPPFTGPTAQAIVAKVMTAEPEPVATYRKTVPEHVEEAVSVALAKLPADRFASATDFANALGNETAGSPSVSRRVPRTARRAKGVSRQAFFTTVGVAAALLVAALIGWLRPAPSAAVSRQRVVLWQHPLEQFIAPGVEHHATQATIAPDGSSIVFVDSVGGQTQLLRKLRSEPDPTLLAGTEGAISPFFSPDGAWVGYVTTDGRLRKIPAGGGGSVTLATDGNTIYNAAAWLDDGSIVYNDKLNDMRRISADGGASSVIERYADRRATLVTLSPLPDGRGVLYTGCPGNCAIGSSVYAHGLGSDSATLLVSNAVGAWHARDGHLLYTDRAGGLYAAGFALDRLQLTTGAVPVIDGVEPARFALSASGSALYTLDVESRAESELVWVSRDGKTELVDPAWRGRFEYPSLSPDGQAIAVSMREATTDLWIRRSDGTRQKVTQEGTLNWRASWTADGRSLVFVSTAGTAGGTNDPAIFSLRVDQSARPELLLRHTFGAWEAELSRDGSWLVFRSDEEGADGNILARRLQGDTAVLRLVSSKATDTQVALSPDGRWLAYTSEISGRPEIYVAAFPDMSSTRLVSTRGGTEARWARSGRELFFKSGGEMISVAVPPGPVFTPGNPSVLFSLAGFRGARNRQQYDVGPGDQRFVMIRDLSSGATGAVVYVENWIEELKAKVGR